jgi:hypothetical protein
MQAVTKKQTRTSTEKQEKNIEAKVETLFCTNIPFVYWQGKDSVSTTNENLDTSILSMIDKRRNEVIEFIKPGKSKDSNSELDWIELEDRWRHAEMQKRIDRTLLHSIVQKKYSLDDLIKSVAPLGKEISNSINDGRKIINYALAVLMIYKAQNGIDGKVHDAAHGFITDALKPNGKKARMETDEKKYMNIRTITEAAVIMAFIPFLETNVQGEWINHLTDESCYLMTKFDLGFTTKAIDKGKGVRKRGDRDKITMYFQNDKSDQFEYILVVQACLQLSYLAKTHLPKVRAKAEKNLKSEVQGFFRWE